MLKWIAYIVVTVLLCTCGIASQQNEQDCGTRSLTKSYVAAFDSSQAAMPIKIFPVVHDGENYLVSLTQGEFKSEEQPEHETITVRVIRKSTNDTLLTTTVVANAFYEMEHPTVDCWWLPLCLSGFGSGIDGDLYEIKFEPQISLVHLMKFYELTSWIPNATADTLMVCTGLWDIMYDTTINPNTDDFEGHFDPHRQEVSLYKIETDSLRRISCDTTQNKYDLVDNPDSRSAFEKQEKMLLEKLKWRNFSKGKIYPGDVDEVQQ